MLKTIILTLTITTYVASEKFRFDNYSLFKILPENEQHIKLLQELQNTYGNYDFWTDPVPSAKFVNVMTSPKEKTDLENFLNFYNIKYEIPMTNIQEAIDKETVKSYTRNNVRSMTWDAYYQFDDIVDWLNDMAAAHSDVATVVVGGITYEGREIKGLKISHGRGRRVIFVEAGIHSREWIVVPFACYLINELLTSDDPATMAAARDFDWYIFPVTNPDGYVWTHEEFRMWRKNRRPITSSAVGVDLNRNWNNNWLVSGVSINPAADNYGGPGPFSEPETRSMSEFLRSIGDEIDIYLSFHSFSQLLLLPFGNTTQPLANYDDAINIGRRAMGALSVRYGTQYVTGNIAEAIYLATGGSVDWVKEHLQVPLVYCYELRDLGNYGFLLPPDQILPSNLETMDSVLELIHQAKRFGLVGSSASIHASMLMTLLFMLTIFM